MSRVTLTRGADHDFVDVDMGRQREQPVNTVGYGPGFEQFAELGDRFAEVFLVITGHILEFTEHDAGHHEGNAYSVRADLAAKTLGNGADGELA